MKFRRDLILLGLLALIVGGIAARAIRDPGYTDAYYYYNGGQRLAAGQGMTDAALWTYIGNPTRLPAPSNLYWMPLTSFVAAAGIAFTKLIGVPAGFEGAQLGFVALYVGIVLLAYLITRELTQSRSAAIFAALLTVCSGYYLPYWFTTATFAPFGFVSAAALFCMGKGRKSGKIAWYAAGGGFAGLAHLTRADGILLIGVLVVIALWPQQGKRFGARIRLALTGYAVYLIVMLPFLVRNLTVVGSLLPTGGLDMAWARSYDEIVNYPPGSDLGTFWQWGLNNIVVSRVDAFGQNLGTFVAVEGLIVLAPFMLIGLWRRRRDPLLSGFIVYALLLHFVMTIVFAFPGWRGGLFHSSAALFPFWTALGVLGLDDAMRWAAKRRRWKPAQAWTVFGGAVLLWVAYLGGSALTSKAAAWNNARAYFQLLEALPIPPDAVVMINDPPAYYYFTGQSGVVLPNASLSVIPEIAAKFGVSYVIVDGNRTLPMNPLWEGRDVPPFLQEITPPDLVTRFRVYRVVK